MTIAENTNIFKIMGIFGTIIVISLYFGGALLGVMKGLRTGDWNGVLKETGGRVFAVDSTLNSETQYLLNNTDTIYLNVFHLLYAFTMLFLLFVVGYLMFKIANWSIGIRSFSPSSDIFIIAFIILSLLLIQFLYTKFILDETIIPMSGVINFLKSLPAIFNKLTL